MSGTMSDTAAKHHDDDRVSRSSTQDAVEDDELPPSQPSDNEHSPIHDQLTAPMGSYKMTYRQVGDDDDDSFSGSDVDSSQKDEASDDGEGGDDEKSVQLSNYASDGAVSYVESCESFDRYTDSSDEEESDEDNTGRSKTAGGICRRRKSNSDSDIDESEEDNEKADATHKESNNKEAANSACDGSTSANMNNLTEVAEKKSSEKFVGIWDDDGTKRKRSSNPVRKLWSDYVYKSDAKQSRGQMRAGARFTNSFTDKRQPEPVDPWWNMGPSNRFPPQLGLGLGRGLMPNNNRCYESNSMRPPGPPRGWQQQRRPNNPYCHYQQQQKYFGMPRGSYASVVQKGPVANTGRADSRNLNPPGKPTSCSRQGNDNRFSQQSHNRQNQPQQPQRPPPGAGPQQRQQQSYNRGTVTAAQILKQQRMQQSQKQQGQQQPPHQGQSNQANRQQWQPPKGPHVRPLMIRDQEVYYIQPSFNRRPIAEEDPAIVRAEPPVPNPYLMLPGGISIPLPTATGSSSTAGGHPTGQIKTGGSGGIHGINQRATAVQ